MLKTLRFCDKSPQFLTAVQFPSCSPLHEGRKGRQWWITAIKLGAPGSADRHQARAQCLETQPVVLWYCEILLAWPAACFRSLLLLPVPVGKKSRARSPQAGLQSDWGTRRRLKEEAAIRCARRVLSSVRSLKQASVMENRAQYKALLLRFVFWGCVGYSVGCVLADTPDNPPIYIYNPNNYREGGCIHPEKSTRHT